MSDSSIELLFVLIETLPLEIAEARAKYNHLILDSYVELTEAMDATF